MIDKIVKTLILQIECVTCSYNVSLLGEHNIYLDSSLCIAWLDDDHKMGRQN